MNLGVGGKCWAGTFSFTFCFLMRKRRCLGECLYKETGQLNGKRSGTRCVSKSRAGEASLQRENHYVFRTEIWGRLLGAEWGFSLSSLNPRVFHPALLLCPPSDRWEHLRRGSFILHNCSTTASTDMAGQKTPQSVCGFVHFPTESALND